MVASSPTHSGAGSGAGASSQTPTTLCGAVCLQHICCFFYKEVLQTLYFVFGILSAPEAANDCAPYKH